MLNLLVFIFFGLIPSNQSAALNLQTEDFAIALPQGWSCDPDESLVICTGDDSQRQKSAIVLINYKKASPTETLADFRSRLSKPKSTQVTNGAPRLSRVVSFQDRVIQGLTWIEALHYEGELPDYYTYYLATRKSGKFFLVTLSAIKGDWEKYRPQFEKTISSLKILTPEPTSPPLNQQAKQPQPIPSDDTKKSVSLSNVENLPEGLTPAKLFLFAAVIFSCLLVLYAIRS